MSDYRMDLSGVFASIATQMRADFTRVRTSVSHPGLRGGGFEEVLRTFLRQYLPSSLDVSTGTVVDASGRQSRQMDVIISDSAKTPILYNDDINRVVPIEGVYTVIEVKANLTKHELERCLENMLSIKTLNDSAYVEQNSIIQQSNSLYSTQWVHWPVSYFIFAIDSISLGNLCNLLDKQVQDNVLPLHQRIDAVCVLNEGVICNETDEGLDALPETGSEIKFAKTPNALLLFYSLLTAKLFQARMPPFNFVKYIENIDLELQLRTQIDEER